MVTAVIPFSPQAYAFRVRVRVRVSCRRAYGSPYPLLVDFHRMLLKSHALALSANQRLCKKNLSAYRHSVRLEPTKLYVVDTRTIYQATEDTGWHVAVRQDYKFIVRQALRQTSMLAPTQKCPHATFDHRVFTSKRAFRSHSGLFCFVFLFSIGVGASSTSNRYLAICFSPAAVR